MARDRFAHAPEHENTHVTTHTHKQTHTQVRLTIDTAAPVTGYAESLKILKFAKPEPGFSF